MLTTGTAPTHYPVALSQTDRLAERLFMLVLIAWDMGDAAYRDAAETYTCSLGIYSIGRN